MNDILSTPEDFYLLQFRVDNKKVVPVHVTPFLNRTSKKHPDHTFASPKASKFGCRKVVGATHWGIVHSPENNENIELIVYGEISRMTNRKATIPWQVSKNKTYYINLRATYHYFSVYVSKVSSVLDNNKTNTEMEN